MQLPHGGRVVLQAKETSLRRKYRKKKSSASSKKENAKIIKYATFAIGCIKHNWN
jgi:hypothetical protein